MAVLFDDEITGSGQASFASTRIRYLLVAVTTLGPQVRPWSARDDDYLTRIGWVTLGVSTSDLLSTELEYWRDPWWINFENMEVSSIPQTDAAGNDLGIWASRVRWSLTLDTVAWLQVVGA